MGRDIVGARLADILLVEAIRAYARDEAGKRIGWLGALADTRIGRSLRAIYEDIALDWTVADLARVAGMSRASFAAAFARRMRQPPLACLRAWRMTLARIALAWGGTTVAAVAEKVGYRSQRAFTQAYRRGYGSSPSIDVRCAS